MPLLCNWNTKVITIPKTELTLDTGTKYKLTVVYWFELLRELNGSVEGIAETINSSLFNNTPPTTSTPRIVDVINGYTVQFEDGLYSVELTNGNTNYRDVEIKNQVSVGTNNTTGFIDPTFLEAGIYDGRVVVDFINGVAGADKTAAGELIGTFAAPSNNVPDALIISERLKVKELLLASNCIINEDLSDGYSLKGTSPFNLVTANPIADLTGVSIELLSIIGELDGLNVLRDCSVRAVTKLSGIVEKCAFTESFHTNGDVLIIESYSNVEGSGYPNGHVGANSTLEVRDWHGSFGVEDIESLSHTVGGRGGRVIVGASCIGGTIHIRGSWFEIIDNSGAECTVLDERDIPAIARAVWDRLLTGSTHNIQNSAGKRLRDIASQAIHTDTAQGAAVNGNQIQLALAASDVDGSYDPSMITIIDGTGAGQTRLIYQYNGATRIATVDRSWKVNPDATSEYIIFAHPGREHVNEGLAQAGTVNTITLNALASDSDEAYTHQIVFLRSGLGEDQIGLAESYNGTTKVLTVSKNWDVVPNGTTGYVILPTHIHTISETAKGIWDSLISGSSVDGSFGELLQDVLKLTGNKVTKSGDIITIYEKDGTTVWKQIDLSNGGRVDV